MRQSVRDVFFDYTAGREGFTPFLYCDTLNLVTTGVGNLVDGGPRNDFVVNSSVMSKALALPWKQRVAGWTSKNPVAGSLVSPSEVADAWTTVKLHERDNPGFNKRGGFAYAGLTNITLDMDAIHELFNRTLNSFDGQLAKHYPTYDQWPADAQLAILSMSWAMGPAFHPALGFQNFFDAANRQDFRAAGPAAVFKGGGSLDDPKSRNAAHQVMFLSAAAVVEGGGDRDRLFFPGTSGAPAPVLPGTRPTTPSIASKVFNPRIGQIAAGTVAVGAAGWGLFDWWKGRKR